MLTLERFIAQLTLNELNLLIKTVIYLKDSMYESNLFPYSYISFIKGKNINIYLYINIYIYS